MDKGIITIAGDLGSGKSTAAQLLLCRLEGYELYSTGKGFRAMAEKQGLTVNELSALAEKDESIDKTMDDVLVELGKSGKKLIVDSRMGWFFIPHSFKVYLAVDYAIAAQRIIGCNRGGTEHYEDAAAAVLRLRERKESERKRFLTKYGVDIRDMRNYDIVIDTGKISAEGTVERIITAFK